MPNLSPKVQPLHDAFGAARDLEAHSHFQACFCGLENQSPFFLFPFFFLKEHPSRLGSHQPRTRPSTSSQA